MPPTCLRVPPVLRTTLAEPRPIPTSPCPHQQDLEELPFKPELVSSFSCHGIEPGPDGATIAPHVTHPDASALCGRREGAVPSACLPR